MKVATGAQRAEVLAGLGVSVMVLVAAMGCSVAFAQTDASAAKAVGDKAGTQTQPAQTDQNKSGGKIVGDNGTTVKQDEVTPNKAPEQGQQQGAEAGTTATPSMTQPPGERKRTSWQMLEEAVTKDRRPQTRIQALAALGMLRSPESERMIGNAMLDADLDVRTAAALAAGETRDPNLTTSLRNLLDDKEPQVAFAAALTLAKMGDRSGEDILMAVVDGDRKAESGVIHGTEHKISRDLHNPGKLARLGAMQGAAMLLGPFGFGLTAIEFMRQSGGDVARAAAIEQIAQEKTDPIHRELLDALKDKDPSVRAAAAKALVDYRDTPTQDAVYTLLLDPKDPARLTAAASYLRIMGVPGPMEKKPVRPASRTQRRLTAKTPAR